MVRSLLAHNPFPDTNGCQAALRPASWSSAQPKACRKPGFAYQILPKPRTGAYRPGGGAPTGCGVGSPSCQVSVNVYQVPVVGMLGGVAELFREAALPYRNTRIVRVSSRQNM